MTKQHQRMLYHFRCLHCSISTWCKTWRSRFCVGWLVDHCQDSCRHLIVLSSVGMWASRHIRLTVLLTSYGVRVVGIVFDLVNEKIYVVDFLVCSFWLRRGLTPHFHTIFWLYAIKTIFISFSFIDWIEYVILFIFLLITFK